MAKQHGFKHVQTHLDRMRLLAVDAGRMIGRLKTQSVEKKKNQWLRVMDKIPKYRKASALWVGETKAYFNEQGKGSSFRVLNVKQLKEEDREQEQEQEDGSDDDDEAEGEENEEEAESGDDDVSSEEEESESDSD